MKRDLRNLKYRAWNIFEYVEIWSWFIKYFNGHDPSLKHLFAVDNNSITKGHNFKLKMPTFKTTIRQHFFNNHVVNNWNSLSFDVVNANSINSFKNKLAKCWENRLYVAWKVQTNYMLFTCCFFSWAAVWDHIHTWGGAFCGDS